MRGFMSSIGLAIASMFGSGSPLHIPMVSLNKPLPTRKPPKRYWFGGNRYRPNGDRECARRARQIEAGQLTSSNGLAA
jgi:hypothetical protein